MSDTYDVVQDGRDLGAFCPAALDDWGLTAVEFRVYMRVCRRAGAGACFESQGAMAESLGISRKTVNETLSSLIALGFLSVSRLAGNRRLYRLLPIPPQTQRCNPRLQVAEKVTRFEPETVTLGYTRETVEQVAEKVTRFEPETVTLGYTPETMAEASCNLELQPVVTLGLQPIKVLPPKGKRSLKEDPPTTTTTLHSAANAKSSSSSKGRHEPLFAYWEGADDELVAVIGRAIASVAKYDRATRPATLERVTELLIRLRAIAPHDDAIRDLVVNWQEFHAADKAGRYGRADPVASMRNQIGHFEPRWAVQKSKLARTAQTNARHPPKYETMAEEIARITDFSKPLNIANFGEIIDEPTRRTGK